MGNSTYGRGMAPEEHFSAEDFEWLKKIAAYDHEDPGRLVFADDGGCADMTQGQSDESS